MNAQLVITRFPLCLLGLLGLTLFASPVAAQVFDSGPSDSTLFDNIINVPPDPNINHIQSFGSDGFTTQLNIFSGGTVGSLFRANSGSEVNISGGEVGNDFHANSGSEVNISGGTFDSRFRANFGSVVNISGGILGSSFRSESSVVNISGGTFDFGFLADVGSEVNISGGTVGRRFRVHFGSVVNISDGTVGDDFAPGNGSEVNISGGVIGDNFEARPGSVVNISGGTIGDDFVAYRASRSFPGGVVNIRGGEVGNGFGVGSGAEVNISGGTFGDDFHASPGSEINFFGTEFFLDGISLNDNLTMGNALRIDNRDVVLSGLLADGAAFSVELNSVLVQNSTKDYFPFDATLTVTLGSPPSLTCDFDRDGDCEQDDINALYASGGASVSDIAAWLRAASTTDNLANPLGRTFVHGDINLDGDVDSVDLGLLLNDFNSTTTLDWLNGNLDDDGEVDSVDLGLLLNNFGFVSASTAAVPEPSPLGIILIAIGAAFVGIRRRSQAGWHCR